MAESRKSKIQKRKTQKECSSEERLSTSQLGTLGSLCIFGVILLAGSTHFFLKAQIRDDQLPFVSKNWVSKVSKSIECSNDYAKEKELFPDCSPKICGRYISDDIVTAEETEILLKFAMDSIDLGGSSGGASILDLHSGALSKEEHFVNVYQLKPGILNRAILETYSNVRRKIQNAIASHFGIPVSSLHLTHPTFFSRITSRPARTVHDEYWHPHVDKETYGSFHYTSLLYLTEYEKDFQGGRFVFLDDGKNSTVEPRPGRISAFTSGSENLHFVEKVTEGTRYAITVSFTCDPSKAIDDPILR